MLIALALCMTLGLNYGVDFKGGSLIELKTKSGNADISALRGQAQWAGTRNVQIQEFGSPDDVLIRMEEQPGGGSRAAAGVKKVLDATDADYVQRRVEVVGPAVSSELRTTGFIAVAAAFSRSLPMSGSLRMAIRGPASNGNSRSVPSSP